MLSYIKRLLFGNSCARQLENEYLIDLENQYRYQRDIETHWITRQCFIFDAIPCGAFPTYEKDGTFAVVLDGGHYLPVLAGYPRRVWVPMIPAANLHFKFEENVLSAFHLAGTLNDRKYKTLEDVEYYYESELYYTNPYLKINTLIAPTNGTLKQMADDFAASHTDVKVFYSEFCSEKRSAGRMLDSIIVLPSCEFVGKIPVSGNEFGVLISETENVCVIQ